MARTRFEFPEDLLEHLGIEEPDQIDLEAIAYYCGAKVRYCQLTTCAARLVGIGDKSIIRVNLYDPEHRRRFSIGHELGHWMHDRGAVEFSCKSTALQSSDWNASNTEARANRFAASLLMPTKMFQPLLADRRLDFQLMKRLHAKFRTSIYASALRSIELTSSAAILVFNGKPSKHWFKRSSKVPFDTSIHWDLHQDTFAFDILYGNAPPMHDARKIAADKWLSHPAAKRHEIYEHTIKIQDNVLTLLSWDNASLIDELAR